MNFPKKRKKLEKILFLYKLLILDLIEIISSFVRLILFVF